LRCLAALAVRSGWAAPQHTVFTVSSPRPVHVTPVVGSLYRISTDLGPAILASDQIPVVLDPPQPRVVGHPLEVAGQLVRVTPMSLGNPHCALFFDSPPDDSVVTSLGPAVERHPFFPRGTNVEFVTPVSRDEIRVRFWERGVGPTQSSGTGSASAALAAIINVTPIAAFVSSATAGPTRSSGRRVGTSGRWARWRSCSKGTGFARSPSLDRLCPRHVPFPE
jgi:diaminopimelate epimerase